MSGPYTKGKDIPDVIWSQFIGDIKSGELDSLIGFPAANLEKIQFDMSQITPLDGNTVEIIRQQVSEILKEYRTAESEKKEMITLLLRAHGEYCKTTGSPKWKRVHNVIAYRYADPKPLTIRMIARKIGKGKEETDHDIREGIDNMVFLLCGYPALAKVGADAYDTVGTVMRNYNMIKTATGLEIKGLLPLKQEKVIEESRKVSCRLCECFDKAVELYSLFCEGYGEIEKRRLDVLKNGYLEGKESVPSIAKRYHSGISTIQNDTRITVKRIAELLFSDLDFK